MERKDIYETLQQLRDAHKNDCSLVRERLFEYIEDHVGEIIKYYENKAEVNVPPETIEEKMLRELSAINKLYPLGVKPKGDFRFEKDGKLNDLSATDLDWAIANL